MTDPKKHPRFRRALVDYERKPSRANEQFLHLRFVRISRGLSQAAVAARVGTTKHMIMHWEKGSKVPSFENARAWANALGFKFVLESL